MEISVNQVHNVLRTYRHLFKEKPHHVDPKGGKGAPLEERNLSAYDPVSISPESIKKRFEEAENKRREGSLPPENKGGDSPSSP